MGTDAPLDKANMAVSIVDTGDVQIDPAKEGTLAKLTITQGAALGSNTQALVGGSVTSSAPTYTTGQISPLSLTTAGALRVDANVSTAPSPNITVNGTLAAAAQTVASAVTGYNSHTVVITGAGWTGTITAETSSDAGATWISSTLFIPSSASAAGQGIPSVVLTATANGTYRFSTTGSLTNIRVRASAWTTGTANIRLESAMSSNMFGFTTSNVLQNIVVSQINSTSTNLAAAAEFTGAMESTLGVAYIQFQFKCDQTCHLYVEQSIDAVPNWDVSRKFVVTAGSPITRSILATAAYYRVRVVNMGSATSTYLRLGTYLTPIANETLVAVSADTMTSVYPDPASAITIERQALKMDVGRNLMTRGVVLTDEGTFADRFPGSSMFTSIPGTSIFTSGGTAVSNVGNTFTADARAGQYVKLTADAESAFTQVSVVNSDTDLELVTAYPGSSASGAAQSSNWKPTTGTGGSIVVGSNACTIASGTNTSAATSIYRRIGGYNLGALTRLSVSQRIANQEVMLGFHDEALDNLVHFRFTGMDNTKVICETVGLAGVIDTVTVTLPGGATSAAYQTYEIQLRADKAAFYINRVLVCTLTSTPSEPYEPWGFICQISNNGAVTSTNVVLSSVVATANSVMNVTAAQLDASKLQATVNGVYNPSQVLYPGQAGPLQIDSAGRLQVNMSASSINKAVQIVFDQAHSAINVGEWQEVLNYTVPATYDLNCISFDAASSAANEKSRAVLKTSLGSYVTTTNTFTDGSAIAAPKYAPKMFVYVTTAIGSGANDAVSITYTNNLGVAGRTGTVTIPKNALVGTRMQVTLQAGDFGVRDVTAVTHTATSQAGAFNIEGTDGLFYLIVTSANTLYQSSSVSLGGAIVTEGQTLTLEYFSNTAVSNARRINLMGTLVPK